MKNFKKFENPCYNTFNEYVDGMLSLYGEKPAVTAFMRNKNEITYTYKEFVSMIYALREVIKEKGYCGKHIAIIGENSIEWVVAYLAIVSSGSIAVCIDAEQSNESIELMINLADVEVAFICESFQDICESMLSNIDTYLLSTQSKVETTYPPLADLCAKGNDLIQKHGISSYTVDKDQTAVICFTSGTSSIPKPVMLSHYNLLINVYGQNIYVKKHDKVFTHLPFYHTYGMSASVLNSLQSGEHLYINGNLKTVMRDLQLANPDTLLTVPLMLENISNQIWFHIFMLFNN